MISLFKKLALGVCLISIVTFSVEAETTLDTKIGQMIMMGIYEKNLSDKALLLNSIREQLIGGIIFFEKDLVKKDTKKNLAQLILKIQENSKIPQLIAIDEEGGAVNRLKPKYGFPETKSAGDLGSLDDENITFFYANQIARNLYDFGFNVNFAPGVDVNLNPQNPVIGKLKRSFSGNYQKVIGHAEVFIDAHDQYNMLTVIKHFPGHGSSHGDTHLGITDVTSYWQKVELKPYKALIEDGKARGVMVSHLVNQKLDRDKLPSTLSHVIVSDLLRQALNFQGIVFSDDMYMGAITENYGFEEAIVLAINAGIDVLVFSNNPKSLIAETTINEIIKSKVLAGEISEQRINESYNRIIATKEQLGLLDKSFLPELKKRLSVQIN